MSFSEIFSPEFHGTKYFKVQDRHATKQEFVLKKISIAKSTLNSLIHTINKTEGLNDNIHQGRIF